MPMSSPMRQHEGIQSLPFPSSSSSRYLQLAQSTYDVSFLLLLLVVEAVLCQVIIKFVAYTEIDWIAYMEEVDCYQGGERDYLNIRGGTGPLVYPAGFLYLFSFLKNITSHGTDILKGQYIFALFYICNTAFVLIIYKVIARRHVHQKANIANFTQNASPAQLQQIQYDLAHTLWSWRIAMVLLCLSKRMHSIFLLRLFNDGPTMVFAYLSVCLFMRNQWKIGCAFFSLAVSIKMNILLFAPGLLLLLVQALPLQQVIICLIICALIQIVLGAPFLLTFPVSYIRKSFELDRVFFYKWTVNWKFLPEDVFVGKPMSILLLSMHLLCLGFFFLKAYTAAKEQIKARSTEIYSKKGKTAQTSKPQEQSQTQTQFSLLTPEYVVCTLFISNFIGIAFIRTLHYQFYSWYFHTIPLLLFWTETYPIPIRIGLWAAMEYSFNVFPATPMSSVVLQISHIAIIGSVAAMTVPNVVWIKTDQSDKPKPD